MNRHQMTSTGSCDRCGLRAEEFGNGQACDPDLKSIRTSRLPLNPTNQPEPSLRDDGKSFNFNLDINASDEFKAGFNEATEQVGRAVSLGNILFQADKEAAVREARTNELNMFMDVNAQTVTDTQGSYIARRYQTLASTEFTHPQAGEGDKS